MKVFHYASTLEIRYERDHYTRHGLHLNTKGKDHTAELLRSTIKNIFNISKITPIIMNWDGKHIMPFTTILGKTGMRMGGNPEAVISQVEMLQHTVPLQTEICLDTTGLVKTITEQKMNHYINLIDSKNHQV
jgi:hypothetical protein